MSQGVQSANERTPLLAGSGFESADTPASRESTLVEADSIQDDRLDANGEADDAPAKPHVSLIAVMAPMLLGIFLVAMDGTIVTSTYASIGSQFEQLQNTSWIATGYMLSLTSFQPLFGKLSDIFGRKSCLLFAYTIFALGCLFCGLARNMTELIAARALTGIGGGGMATVGSIIMSDVSTLRQRGTLQGIANVAWAVGQATGAPLGGFLADNIGWRWAFMLQVPLAFLAILTVGIFLTLPRSPTGDLRAKVARIDFAGAFTLVASIFLLLLGLDRGGNVAWRDTTTIASLAGAGAFFALFVLVELRWAREPCAPKRIVTNRTLLASYLANLFSNAAGITLIFSVSLYLQAVQGARAGEVGLILLPTIFGGVAGSLGIGLIMQATGKYYVATVASFALMLFGTVVVALVTGPWKYTLAGLSFGIIANNLGIGAGITSTLVALVANAGPEDQAVATAVSYLFRSLGSVVGLSVGTTLTNDVVRNTLRKRLSGDDVEEIIRRVRESLAYMNQLEPAVRAKVVLSYQDGLQAAFWFSAVLCAVTLVTSFFIKEKPL
ncbi:hypothetical protein V8D89_006320, partial [Ganoderma adspersum]